MYCSVYIYTYSYLSDRLQKVARCHWQGNLAVTHPPDNTEEWEGVRLSYSLKWMQRAFHVNNQFFSCLIFTVLFSVAFSCTCMHVL